MLTEGVWFEIFLSCPGDLLAIALSWLSPEKGGQGYPLVNVRGVGESHEIVKQTDSGFGVDAWESLGRLLSPEALLNSSLPHDLVMGGISRGGSHQWAHFFNRPFWISECLSLEVLSLAGNRHTDCTSLWTNGSETIALSEVIFCGSKVLPTVPLKY